MTPAILPGPMACPVDVRGRRGRRRAGYSSVTLYSSLSTSCPSFFQLALHPLPSSLSESPPSISILPIPTPSPHLLPLSPTKPPLLPPFTTPLYPYPSQAREWARLKKPVLESKIKELERKCVAIRGRIDTELHLGGPWTLHSVPCSAILLLALSLSSSLLLQAPSLF